MPHSPDDCEGDQPARKSKRTRRTTTPRRTNSTTSRADVAALLATDTSWTKPDATRYSPEILRAAETLLSQDPLVILGAILKVVLGERIKDEEILYICKTHYQILMNKPDE
jgi:hypothetical protein